MTDESVTVKGTPVRSLQKFIDANLTHDQREIVFRNLPAEYAARFRSPILATETVPVHMLNRFTEEAAKARGEPIDAFARRAGREGASDAVKGVYRFFALVLKPPALLAKASVMWSSLYNKGELRVLEESEHGARIRLVDFPSESAGCCRISGWIERLAELTGSSDVAVDHPECFATGARYCEWVVRWS